MIIFGKNLSRPNDMTERPKLVWNLDGASSKPINCDPYWIFLWAVNWFNDSSILHHLNHAKGSVKCSGKLVRLSPLCSWHKNKDSITGFEISWFSMTIILFLLLVLGFLHTGYGQLPPSDMWRIISFLKSFTSTLCLSTGERMASVGSCGSCP